MDGQDRRLAVVELDVLRTPADVRRVDLQRHEEDQRLARRNVPEAEGDEQREDGYHGQKREQHAPSPDPPLTPGQITMALEGEPVGSARHGWNAFARARRGPPGPRLH